MYVHTKVHVHALHRYMNMLFIVYFTRYTNPNCHGVIGAIKQFSLWHTDLYLNSTPFFVTSYQKHLFTFCSESSSPSQTLRRCVGSSESLTCFGLMPDLEVSAGELRADIFEAGFEGISFDLRRFSSSALKFIKKTWFKIMLLLLNNCSREH